MLSRIDQHFRAPAPAERLAALRVLVGSFALVYLAARGVHLASVTGLAAVQFRPVGVVRVLSSPLPALAVQALVVAAIAAGIAYVIGLRFRVTGPLFAALLLWVTSYRNSWGMIFHTENLAVLHVLVLGVVRSADALSLDARRKPQERAPDARYGWPIRLLCAITVLTYVIAGVSKLRNAGYDWVSGDVLRNYVAHDNVRKIALGDAHSSLGGSLVGYRWLWPPLALVSMIVELGAPLALVHRRLARAWVAVAWLFHIGVLALMAIFFPYPALGVAFAPFFPIERALEHPWARRILASARPRRADQDPAAS
jgi:Vitamin K-dependent gamma-carboxylase